MDALAKMANIQMRLKKGHITSGNTDEYGKSGEDLPKC